MKKFFIIALGLCFGVLLAEMYLRIFVPHTSLSFYQNETFGSALIPNQSGLFATQTGEYKTGVKVNSHGWPDIEHSFNKPEGVYRIVILGDSFVENFQVPLEERFFRQIQNELNGEVEIIALGRGNTGTAQQFLILKNYGLKYNPDLVIQMFLTANDVKNNSPALQNDPFLPYFKISGSGGLELVPQTIKEDSSLKSFLKSVRVVELLLSIRQAAGERKANLKNDYPVDYHVYDNSYPPAFQNAWEITKSLILETKNLSEKSGAEYILVSLANNEQVNSEVREEIFKSYPTARTANLDFEKPDKILEEFSKENKINYWQMLPSFKEFRDQNEGVPTHFKRDGHWNKAGTNIAAEFLTEKIKAFLNNP